MSAPGLRPTDEDPCGLLPDFGPAKDYCKKGDNGDGGGSGSSPGDSIESGLDPIKGLAKYFQEGAAWVVDRLSSAVGATGDVDFTDLNFVKTYAIVFAAATILVLMVWMWGVMKRAVRGVPLTTALSEAVGLLVLAVGASAFTPLVLYTLVGATDAVTEVLTGTSSKSPFFGNFSQALREGISGGPIVQIIVSLLVIVAAGVLWLELTVRAALLYVGAMLGTIVYSGLVEKDLWGKVRKWAAMMVAIILLKPIIVIILKLASALTTSGATNETTGAVISGMAILVIAILASSMLFSLVPGMGDDIVNARRNAYDPASRQSLAAITQPAAGVRQGINTHGARDQQAHAKAGASAGSGGQQQAASGMSAHANRPSDKRGGGGNEKGGDR